MCLQGFDIRQFRYSWNFPSSNKLEAVILCVSSLDRDEELIPISLG